MTIKELIEHGVTSGDVRSYLTGNYYKILTSLGIKSMTDAQQMQVHLRAELCNDCAVLGKCKICKCKTPNLFFDPLRVDEEKKWGEMLSDAKFDEFLKGKELLEISELANEYSELYKQMSSEEKSDQSTDEETEITASAEVKPFPSMTLNLGKIKHNVPRTCTFMMTNDREYPLEIYRVQPTCQCTLSSFSNDVIQPGETYNVSAVYSANTIGQFTKDMYVFYKGIIPTQRLTLVGEVIK